MCPALPLAAACSLNLFCSYKQATTTAPPAKGAGCTECRARLGRQLQLLVGLPGAQHLASRVSECQHGPHLEPAQLLTCLVSSSMQMAPPPRTYLQGRNRVRGLGCSVAPASTTVALQKHCLLVMEDTCQAGPCPLPALLPQAVHFCTRLPHHHPCLSQRRANTSKGEEPFCISPG